MNNTQKLLLETAEQYKEIIYKDNKVFAKLSWIKPWAKNPKFIEKTDLEKLKAQIKELKLYKPLLVCLNNQNAIILGGNQRYLALQELSKENPEKYEYVWISLVEALTDEEMLKYALSDNLSLGKINREQLNELVKPLAGQEALFNNYGIEFSNIQSIKEFTDNFLIGDDELKLKNVAARVEATTPIVHFFINYKSPNSKNMLELIKLGRHKLLKKFSTTPKIRHPDFSTTPQFQKIIFLFLGRKKGFDKLMIVC